MGAKSNFLFTIRLSAVFYFQETYEPTRQTSIDRNGLGRCYGPSSVSASTVPGFPGLLRRGWAIQVKGVAVHPNDAGMMAISNAVSRALTLQQQRQ